MEKQKLDTTDKNILKDYFSLFRLDDDFEDILHKRKIKGAIYYSFPFFNESGEVENYRNFHLNYDTRDGSDKESFWTLRHNINLTNSIHTLLISDHPLEILRYYSQHYERIKDQEFLGIVPYHLNQTSLTIIANKFIKQKIATIYRNPVRKELQKLFTAAAFVGQRINVEHLERTIKLSNGKKEIEVEEIKYNQLRRFFNFHRQQINIKHL